ncbi:unnamed protein product [Enterobius vermicularis]|uniref:Flavoprotein n=1 Tax=Enterobius vermicularis TaxID=51028 RepID=A0A0N4VLT1_ENTVE|nr:unnamed protein product [Enterobius vermicularis]
MKTHTLLITGSKAKEFAADVAAVFKGVFQNDIDKLRGDAPLSLHSLCECDYSSHPGSLVVLTVGSLDMGTYADCENAISSLLVERWQNPSLNADKIFPIISRIASYTICLTN